MGNLLAGIITPVLTPLDASGMPDLAALRKHVRRLLGCGIHGIWVNGSTGEFFALTPTQRAECVKACVDEVDGAVPVVAQVGAPATQETVLLARDALTAGATHLAVIAPFYADFSQREMIRHYEQVHEATGRPVVLYHLPKLTKIGLSIDSIVELSRSGTAVAIKDSANDMTWFRSLLLAASEHSLELRCFTGGASLTDLGLFLGGAGAMPALSNLAPRTCVAIYDAVRAGQWPRAVELQRNLDRLIAMIRLPDRTTVAATTSVYKFLLTELGQLPTDAVCAPADLLSRNDRARLKSVALPYLESIEGDLLETHL